MITSANPSTPDASVSLLAMLRSSVVDVNDKPLAKLQDALVRFRDADYPLLIGLVSIAGGIRTFIPADEIIEIAPGKIRLKAASIGSQPFERRDGEVLLRAEILGRRMVDLGRGALVKAHDVRLANVAEQWRAVGVDVHKHSWLQFGSHETHAARDWHDFLLLVGVGSRAAQLLSSNQFRRLKPAQIANIIESAPAQEQGLLLALVHADPKLEANVFEELDDDRQAKLLRSRSDHEVSDVLSRMRADDAADAIMELPQDRRSPVLDLLPAPQKAKILVLLGYGPATAGGLMGTEFLALTQEHSIHDAISQLRAATSEQPEALVTIHSLHLDGRLAGTLGLVRALQLDPETLLRDAADSQTIVAFPNEDIVAVTTRMADYNLLSLPVVDDAGRMLGIVTVDDALEAAIPRDWSKREASQTSSARKVA